MKPQRAIGLVTAIVLVACVAAWLTTQQPLPSVAAPIEGLDAPVVFSVR